MDIKQTQVLVAPRSFNNHVAADDAGEKTLQILSLFQHGLFELRHWVHIAECDLRRKRHITSVVDIHAVAVHLTCHSRQTGPG